MPVHKDSNQTISLLVRLGSRLCAIPLASVVECMRPLPTEALKGAPSFLLGISVIRGLPVPVVNLGRVLGTGNETQVNRYVLLKLNERRVALAVESVIGVQRMDSALQNLPPLLQEAAFEQVTAIGIRDEQLLFVLQMARVIPDEVWQTLESNKGSM